MTIIIINVCDSGCVCFSVRCGMEPSYEPGCWSFLQALKAYRRKKQNMAYNRAVFDSPAANRIGYALGAKKEAGYRTSRLSQDSGYNESLKAFSPGCCETSDDSSERNTTTNEYENSENLDPTLLCSLLRCEIWERETGTVTKRQAQIYETPRGVKKDFSLRRRLLVAKATSGGNLDFEASECLMETSKSKKANQRLAGFETGHSSSLDSPRETIYKPLATSTLKAEPDVGTSSKNWRTSFAQQRSSTIDDSKCDHDPFSEVDNLSPVKHSSESPNDSILSSSENIPEMPSTPICNLMSRAKEDFQTPVSDLAASFRFTLCSPTAAQVSDLENSITEDSAFHSLSFDKSQDSLSDHEGSFQELIQKPKEAPKSALSKSRLRKLDRCRRLSTLRERGSQSEVDEDYNETRILSSTYKSKVARESVDEEEERSFVDSQICSLLKVEDLTGTPALRVVREMLVRSTRKRTQQTTVQDLLGSFDSSSPPPEDVLTKLIGRKMGLEKVDIFYELKFRNLNHILAFIFKVLDVESICSIWKVSKDWREMVVQDKDANQRRKLYFKKMRAEIEQGRMISSEDAATRLQVLNRSALKSVQAQARLVFHTPTSSGVSLTPRENTGVPQSRRKQQEYIKIAKTLFTDEALKPCPQCQYPAKYQPLKKRGKCSRKDCGFDFCVLCLCAFHGSKECGTGSGKRVHKKDILPGSAQSKRNLKRL